MINALRRAGRGTRWAVYCGGALVFLMCMHQAPLGMRINTSRSLPRGLYAVYPGMPAVGEIALACPPDSAVFRMAAARGYLPAGMCAGGFAELLKIVAAVGGDVVEVTPDGVHIDGRLWPRSAPSAADPHARPLLPARLHRVLGPDEMLLLSAGRWDGFDARYFGAVSRDAVLGTAVPVWLWEGEDDAGH